MRVTAIGTSGGVPTAEYGTSGVYLDAFGDRYLFDCGEGSQRRLMRYEASPNVDAVFITHFHADHTLGLPGLIQTLEMNERERPLDVYVPDGRTERATRLIDGAYGRPSYPVDVRGYGADEPIVCTDRYRVRAFETPYTDHSHGLSLTEASERTLLVDRARELGVNPGPKYAALKRGQTVETDDGRTVAPDDVLSEPKPGRKVVYTGDTTPVPAVVDAASGASLLVHNAMFSDAQAERARSTGHSTARQAGRVAAESNSDALWLTHVSPRHEGDERRLRTEAEAEFDGPVTVVRDGDSAEL